MNQVRAYSTSPLSLTQSHLDECPTSNTFRCECPKTVRQNSYARWMNDNKDTLSYSFFKGVKPGLDTPGFLPLRYQLPM